MKLGLFGGTFDPIHRGHVEPAKRALERLQLDRLFFAPTALPPHKSGPRHASALRRFAMVEMALLDEPRLEVSEVEMTRSERAYTVETLESLREEHPGARLFLLVGADAFRQLPSWRRWREILEMVETAVMVRPGWRLEEEDLVPEQRAAIEAKRVHFVENPPVDLSGTEIRRRLREGKTLPDGALHPRVLDYVQKYGLYRE